MKAVKTEKYGPRGLKQLKAGAQFVGRLVVPEKPAVKHTDKMKKQNATPSYTLDYYVLGKMLFAARDGMVIFAVNQRHIVAMGLHPDTETWSYTVNFRGGQTDTVMIEVPDGHDYNAAVNRLAAFYNQ